MKLGYLHGVELLTIGQKTLLKAHRRFVGCEQCDVQASTPFELILEDVVGITENYIEYLLPEPAKCPNCNNPVFETTLVHPDAEFEETQNVEKFYVPNLEDTNFVFIEEAVLTKAKHGIEGCEYCCPDAEITFDYILDEVTGCDPQYTEYILSHPTSCPACFHEVTEKTLVIPS
jgi:hypothetical protein